MYKNSFQAGWNAGAFVNLWLGNHFAIAPEVLYTTNWRNSGFQLDLFRTIFNNRKVNELID